MKKYKIIIGAIIIAIEIITFFPFFRLGQLTAGDWILNYRENLSNYTFIPQAWSPFMSNGMGGNNLALLALDTFYRTTSSIFLNFINPDWQMYERIMWFWPYILLSFCSSYFFSLSFFKNKILSLFSAFIYSANTYSLMLVGGGQIAIAISYALVPLVFYLFDKLIKQKSQPLFQIVLTASVYALQILYDTRIAFVSAFIFFIYYITVLLKKPLTNIIITAIVVFFLHATWIMPLLFYGGNPLSRYGSEFISSEMTKFLSFTNFSNSISLLHPNWPENIFGKTYFLQPEFLILPIIAFSSLLFKNNKKIIYFALLGLIGIFLSKGSNPPFGGIYLWLFNHFPGFIMFRDSTKWLTLVAFSYSILIPYSLQSIYGIIKTNKKLLPFGYAVLTASGLLFLYSLKPALLGQLSGTFSPLKTPEEYVALKDFLHGQKDFFRTLWIPSVSRFGYYSYNHPSINGMSYFKTNSPQDAVLKLMEPNSLLSLQKTGVKYVIVPWDIRGEMFLTERKYDENIYINTINGLMGSRVNGLKRINGFGKIAVFEVPDPENHFFINGLMGSRVNGTMINPTKYKVNIENANKGDVLNFSESYDPNWIANTTRSMSNDNINSFVLPKDGNYSLEVYYKPQEWVNYGFFLSLITTIVVLVVLVFKNFRKLAVKTYWNIFRGFDSSCKCKTGLFNRVFNDVSKLKLSGDYYEFGVFKGYSLYYAQVVTKKMEINNIEFYGFDSFKGLPSIIGKDADGEFFKGEFSCSKFDVENNLRKNKADLSKIHLIEGFYEDTLNEETVSKYKMKKAAVIYIDCDLYSSTKIVLDFIKNIIKQGTIIIFDDWNSFSAKANKGERLALEEFLTANPAVKLEDQYSFCWHGQVFKVTDV